LINDINQLTIHRAQEGYVIVTLVTITYTVKTQGASLEICPVQNAFAHAFALLMKSTMGLAMKMEE
jgi:hypothetical protein